ncbi:MAG: hypothetical protein P0121_16895 [Nitrospira sp.]|nr:hypothetical protein [Nitrospira sp.]
MNGRGGGPAVGQQRGELVDELRFGQVGQDRQHFGGRKNGDATQ